MPKKVYAVWKSIWGIPYEDDCAIMLERICSTENGARRRIEELAKKLRKDLNADIVHLSETQIQGRTRFSMYSFYYTAVHYFEGE